MNLGRVFSLFRTAAEGTTVEFDGEFEIHLTVRVARPADADALGAWAVRNQLKFHHIVLDRGETPSQPMIGGRSRGRLSEVRAEADGLTRRLAAGGFTVTRVKIEAATGNCDVPSSDAEAIGHSGRYFEAHVKLVLDPGADATALVAIARRHAAHLSRNAFRVRSDRRTERFVTQRSYAVGRATSRRQLDSLVADLAAGYVIQTVEEEYVVLDTAPGLDAGWLDAGETS